MVALARYRASLCQRCHGSLEETTDPAHDPNNPHGTHRYEAADPVECYRCRALQQSERRHSDPEVVAYPLALIHQAQLVPRRSRRRKGGGDG
jgi:hypothetical protein